MSTLGSWVIAFSVVIILVATALGALIGLKDASTRITTGLISGVRFTPIGLIVIMTQLHGQGTYLAPALVFALIDTLIPFVLGAEIGPARQGLGAEVGVGCTDDQSCSQLGDRHAVAPACRGHQGHLGVRTPSGSQPP